MTVEQLYTFKMVNREQQFERLLYFGVDEKVVNRRECFHWSQITNYKSLITVHYSLFTDYCSQNTVHCSLFTVHLFILQSFQWIGIGCFAGFEYNGDKGNGDG